MLVYICPRGIGPLLQLLSNLCPSSRR